MNISECVAVVTSGASGLGDATVRMLIGAGARVLIADTNVEAGALLSEELGSNAFFQQVDVSDEEQSQRCIDELMSRWGPLNVLVNCAGIAPAAKVLGKEGIHALNLFSKVVSVNLVGTFNMVRLAAKTMSQAKDEKFTRLIVNTASIAAFDGQIGQAAYAASKNGVVGMMLPFARELGRYKIRVNTIAPGIMETPMVAGMPADVQASLASMIPCPSRLGWPDEYAALVKHMIENEYLNGEVVRLDGAVRMAAR